MAKNISNQAIFGEYKKPEDKVTAALLQVLHYGGHDVICSIFDGIDLPSNDINIAPQVTEDESRPDGLISCDCKYKIYIESKIVHNALNNEHGKKQIEANKKLSSPNDAVWMIYVTPDESIPNELKDVSEIIWINWQTIVEKLKDYKSPDKLIEFLIDQFCLFVDHIVFHKRGRTTNGMLSFTTDVESDKDQRVIVVGGAWGEDVALNYGFYACQEGRYFLPAKYLAFYHKNRIKNLFEIVGTPIESTLLTSELVGDDYLNTKEPNYDKKPRKYFKLRHIKTFNPIIENDTIDKNGNKCAYTYNQRYTTYDAINSASKTSEL